MKTLLNFLALVLFLVVFLGCSPKKGNTKITFYVANGKGQTILVATTNMVTIGADTLAITKTDSLGNASAAFDLSKPVFVFCKIDERYTQLFLSPDDDLQIFIDSTNTRYKGTGAEAANYLNQSNKIRQRFEQTGGNFFYDLDSSSFIKRYDSLNHSYSAFHKAFLDTTKINNEVCYLFENRNKLNSFSIKQNYAMAVYDAVEKEAAIPKFFRNIDDEIPFNSSFLESKMGEYAQVLQLFTFGQNNELYKGKNINSLDSLEATFPLEHEIQIINSIYPDFIKELLLAKNINYWIATLGVTVSTKQIYENFVKDSKYKEYMATVKNNYQKYDAITEGKPAPNIVGTTLEGKSVSLTDLKGKVVYIDVWATWCGPCREALPKTRLIEKKYKGNNKVAFIYLSTDQDIESWKTLLKKDKSFAGIQLHDEPDKNKKTVTENYLIWGIPRYLLIGSDGKIVNSFAPAPSSGKVENLVNQLLKNGTQ